MSRTIYKREAREIQDSLERTDQIRREAEKAGISQTELAYHAGISLPSLYLWYRSGLTPERYLRLIDAIGRARAARAAAGKG